MFHPNKKKNVNDAEPNFPPDSIYLTIRPESFLPDQSEKKINIEEIRSLCGRKNNKQQDENLKEIGSRCEEIKFLLRQLATLKVFSQTQVFDNNFKQQEKENYESFLNILNSHNFDLVNVSETIIEDIKTEYDK